MIEKFMGNVSRHHLLSPKDSIVVAVSGGMDSMALLHILICIKDAFQLKLFVAHLNHGVRGKEADEDAFFVRRFALEHHLSFFEKTEDMNAYARENGLSKEEAGRKLRYLFFEEVRRKCGAEKIAVAHNMDDQAETVLFRLMRGTGLQGLSGISFQYGRIIRPLLNISRAEIEEYIIKFSIPFREDSTNQSVEYTRNRIRLELIPYIEKHFNPRIKESLYRLSKNAEEGVFLSHLAGYEHYLSSVICEEGWVRILRNSFTSHPDAIRHYILKQVMLVLKTDSETDSEKIFLLDRFLLTSETGKKIELGNGYIAECVYEEVIISRSEGYEMVEMEVEVGGRYRIANTSYQIQLEKVKKTDEKKMKSGKYTKYFAWEKIQFPLTIRNRQPGDRIFPYGMKGSKLLSDIFTDEKVPRRERNSVPLLVSGEEILWVIGFRDDRRFCVEKETKDMLKVSIADIVGDDDKRFQ